MKFAHLAAWALLALPVASPAQTRPAAAPLTRAEQLDIMADFFVPRPVILPISRELCDTAFRTQLARDPGMPEIEKALPGIVDRMVKASSAHCDVEMKKIVEARQDQVRTYMAAQFSPAELARLARLLAPSVQEASDFKLVVRPGDSMQQLVAQVSVTPQQEQRLRAAQVAFARTPGGVALINRVHAYELSMKPLLNLDQTAIRDIANQGYKLAHREANLYAQEKDLLELYSDAPIPPRPAALAEVAPPPGTDPLPAKLSGSFVYVYSFLDVRQNEYTPKVLDQFDDDLTTRLNAAGISSKILRYTESAKGKDEFVAAKTQVGDDSRAVPVAETIGGNLADERTTKARFRLIVFPANFTLSGAWRFYDIRFILMDTATNKRLLEYTYSGKHLVMMRDSENAQARSRKILDAAFAELRAKGFL
ncbi:hypothetical protein U1769_00005 [Sphingomonas sp. ZT3P38]|uniref:hypothetical protein n=1 Tax=Parasphingomonas zepuensis TaxID=3096161 RepID=UPI002FC5EF1D